MLLYIWNSDNIRKPGWYHKKHVQQQLLVLVDPFFNILVGLVVTTVATSYSTLPWTVNMFAWLIVQNLEILESKVNTLESMIFHIKEAKMKAFHSWNSTKKFVEISELFVVIFLSFGCSCIGWCIFFGAGAWIQPSPVPTYS